MIVLTGTYTANCAILALPSADVQSMLMPTCSLAPQSVTPPGSHPVILMMGNETNVRFQMLPFLPGIQYLEVTLAVPWVVYNPNPSTAVAHPSRLWLNKFMPMFGGRIFGFPKRLARIEAGADSYSVRSYLLGLPVLSARYGVTREPGSPSSFPNFAPLAPIFQQLFLLRLFCLFPTITMDMHWEMAAATMQALNATIDVDAGADPGIPPGSYSIEGIDKTVTGGFRLTVDWRLAWPKPPG